MITVPRQKITNAEKALLLLVSLSFSSYVTSFSTTFHQHAAQSKNVCRRILISKQGIAQSSTHQSKCKILFSSTKKNSESTEDVFEMDAESLGIYTEEDFNCLTEYEWEDPNTDPNIPSPNLEYFPKVEIDEEGIEVGWTPYFGSSNAIDTRTVISPVESYMIDPQTRMDSVDDEVSSDDDDDNDVEKGLNEQVQNVRKGLKRVDTYIDPWLNAPVPRHVAKWYGYPEKTSFPKKDFMNNRFTKPEDKTDFEALTPFRARQKAIELARSTNNEWLPDGMSREHKLKRQAIYKEKKVLVGSLEKGDIDKDVEKRIQPALKILGSCVELLQISEGFENKLTVFRFHYKGAMKNRRGMAAWTETLIRDCGVECTGVVFETGGRGKDKYD